jgi:Secretion system C-terminal sorting domain
LTNQIKKPLNMKKIYVSALALLFSGMAFSQVVLNEILVINNMATVELHNAGGSSVDVSGYYLCNFPTYMALSSLTMVSDDDLILDAGEFLVISAFPADNAAGEIGLYMNNTDFADSDNIVDYMEYGEAGHQREPVAVAAGQWVTGGFVPTPNFLMGHAMAYDGSGDAPGDWQDVFPPTPDAANNTTSSVGDLDITPIITVYPNPSTDRISVASTAMGIVRIYDVRGTLVREMNKSAEVVTIDLDGVVNGNYYITLGDLSVKFRKD